MDSFLVLLTQIYISNDKMIVLWFLLFMWMIQFLSPIIWDFYNMSRSCFLQRLIWWILAGFTHVLVFRFNQIATKVFYYFDNPSFLKTLSKSLVWNLHILLLLLVLQVSPKIPLTVLLCLLQISLMPIWLDVFSLLVLIIVLISYLLLIVLDNILPLVL